MVTGGSFSSNEKKNRYLVLNEQVSDTSSFNIIKEINEINKFDDEQESKVVGYEREPITLVVNTPGGSVYDGFALVTEIILSKTPVHTYCPGKAFSMGFIIMLAGHKRTMGAFATLMYHEISTQAWDSITGIKRTVEEAARIQKLYDDYVLKRTNILQEKLDDVKEKQFNWFIGADDCKKLGIIDEILS